MVARLHRAADRVLAAVGRPGGRVDIDVVDDHEIRRLNARHRGIRRRTDVLAFPLEIEESPSLLVGQIVVSAATALRQSRRVGVSFTTELDLLVTHGVLHLVGWDDRDPLEAQLMHRREREILSSGARRPPDRLWSGLLYSEGASTASTGASARLTGASARLSETSPRKASRGQRLRSSRRDATRCSRQTSRSEHR